ncbi:MAG: methylamine methyltransferase corrinoid protein reductive activase [Methanosarcinaceae archaeon]|nr:methylamine methyltransferase corrinoid protein reductive activase [Methanosarcinaceae archaeon]
MYAIALDLGTSGFRAQLLNLETKKVIQTIITMGHPLPGGNVMDHLDFAINTGEDVANEIIIQTVTKMFKTFDIDFKDVRRIAVCGNPIQLSLFQNMEIRDLAYAGETKLKKLGITVVDRSANRVPANEIFGDYIKWNDSCYVAVPPAIKHEIGADALAMMTETDFLKQDSPCMVTDYGTNAEMAIKVGDKIITASAAAGPAIEGQGITCGMLASPGAISDVNKEGDYWRLTVLDENMLTTKGDLVDPVTGEIHEKGEIEPVGITGTGVIACVSVALKTGLIKKLPTPPNGKIILGNGIEISDKDIVEVGKAIGAIRAAQATLMVAAGLEYDELEYAYISGATGTYVDGKKAADLGSVPSYAKNVVQFGNTSISLAHKLAIDDSYLEELDKIAKKITADHLMMATSQEFKDIYVCELSYWEQGMDIEMFKKMMEMFGLKPFPFEARDDVNITRRVFRDIDDVGEKGLKLVPDIGIMLEQDVDGCIFCRKCVKECPENAIDVIQDENKNRRILIDSQHCLGTSCRRCVTVCSESVINHAKLNVKKKDEAFAV